MVKTFEAGHLDAVMDIWLGTNLSAHDFVERAFWEGASDAVREQLPLSQLFVFEEEGVVAGFIGITDKTYIAGLFVADGHRSRGIGQQLLDHCKGLFPRLELDVFVKNTGAVRFYERNGFVTVETKRNPDFGQDEFHMVWTA